MQYIKDQIAHALAHQEELIQVLASEADNKLAGRLDIIHLQSVICEKDKDVLTAEFLAIMRRIIIEARLYKWTHNIPDELNEAEQLAAEMKLAQEKHKERTQKLKKLNIKAESAETKHPVRAESENNKGAESLQLGLF